jgi:hypothetical protein
MAGAPRDFIAGHGKLEFSDAAVTPAKIYEAFRVARDEVSFIVVVDLRSPDVGA